MSRPSPWWHVRPADVAPYGPLLKVLARATVALAFLLVATWLTRQV